MLDPGNSDGFVRIVSIIYVSSSKYCCFSNSEHVECWCLSSIPGALSDGYPHPFPERSKSCSQLPQQISF